MVSEAAGRSGTGTLTFDVRGTYTDLRRKIEDGRFAKRIRRPTKIKIVGEQGRRPRWGWFKERPPSFKSEVTVSY